ncbi:hypothetical protein REJC140_02428 [Pseudorhizobium endolithicum]|uniref:Uncharacterized protein n=1 Tax=Pseudorhizobium endolithicum TaxID=1191678 RepID=A0ABM8PFD4_9HYPH|nr:type II toxin-antitoxin system VapB family antitoxin [Pseudorhizobium endolithicum]CAD6420636.1 hypothetical protein REQ54_02127 [Rhizobium sp. Q54]CAD7026865.1 hypothetical protein REJC140_02428 [Pseudorhizobium endolithicum]
MRASLDIDDRLLSEAERITGLPAEATVKEALQRLVDSHRQHSEFSNAPQATFEALAAEFRALVAGRTHTPSEELMREGRSER